MIALDTNVVLRYLVGDDAVQADLAATFLETQLSEGNPGFISLVVVCELVWALTRAYDQPRATVAAALTQLVNTPQLVVESAEVVEAAIGHENADIADAIIHQIGQAAGCAGTVTFDRKFARVKGVVLLGG